MSNVTHLCAEMTSIAIEEWPLVPLEVIRFMKYDIGELTSNTMNLLDLRRAEKASAT